MISKNQQKKIAEERIEILFKQAKEIFNENPKLSDRYVSLARKLSMKYKVKIAPQYKKQFCKKCYKFLVPGKTLRTRIKNKVLIYYCKYCDHITRYPFSKKSKSAS